MEINTHNADILLSAANKSHYPQDEIPEVALAGRSNVGKSSFINTLLNRKNLARTSGKPGKTQLLNFFNNRTKTTSSSLSFNSFIRNLLESFIIEFQFNIIIREQGLVLFY